MTPKQIKELRQSLKMTQDDFAQAVGVRWGTINRWENGKSKPHKIFVKIMKEMNHKTICRERRWVKWKTGKRQH